MTDSRLTVGILCGGMSGEHQISLTSAYNIFHAMDRSQYRPILIGIDWQGQWLFHPQNELLQKVQEITKIHLSSDAIPVYPLAGGKLISLRDGQEQEHIQVFFPITHGAYGEDGALQGWLKILKVPYVGCDVEGSAICMDKDVTKRLLANAGLPVTPSMVIHTSKSLSFQEVSSQLGLPLFVKPCRTGSSLGVNKVQNANEFQIALDKAFQLDHKVLLESMIVGKEIECAVLGNEDPQAAEVLGEIIPKHEFYSYEAKYLDDLEQIY